MSKLSNERMEKNKITVEEALAKLNSGHSLDRYSIDFADTGIEALDVMKLAKAGKTVPESLVFYSDDDIEDDEDFAGYWQEIDVDPVDELKDNTLQLNITLKEDVKAWLSAKNIKTEELVETLLDSFYRLQTRTDRKGA